MPEKRVIETIYGVGGYDPTKPNNNIIEQVTAVISDAQLAIEAAEAETKAANDQAMVAYKNFASLSLAQRNTVLKALLGDFISRHKENYL